MRFAFRHGWAFVGSWGAVGVVALWTLVGQEAIGVRVGGRIFGGFLANVTLEMSLG